MTIITTQQKQQHKFFTLCFLLISFFSSTCLAWIHNHHHDYHRHHHHHQHLMRTMKGMNIRKIYSCTNRCSVTGYQRHHEESVTSLALQHRQQQNNVQRSSNTGLYIFPNQKSTSDDKLIAADTATSTKFITAPIFVVAWIILVLWTLSDIAPGSLTSDADMMMLQEFVTNPIDPPNVNPLFILAFNLFGPLPLLLGNLIIPNSSRSYNGLRSSVPYIILSALIGFYGLAPFLAIRQSPNMNDNKSERSWYTNNVIENKLFSWFIVLFYCYLPFGTNFVSYAHDVDSFVTIVQDFMTLFTTSRLVHASTLDLILCYMTLTYYLIPIDYQLRNGSENNMNPMNRNIITLFAGLFPFVGTAIYCALRPPIPSDTQEESK